MSKEFLYSLLDSMSVSGHEIPLQKKVIAEMTPHCDKIITDYTGNVVCVLNPDAPFKVMLAAHIDEIGLIVTHIQPDGLLRVSKSGGIFPGVLLMPVLPFIEDNERNLRGIVARAADCGARFIYPQIGVTLRANQRQWYYERLDERLPGLREKYEETYGERYDCASPRAAELYAVLEDACRERGVLLHMPEIIAASRKPYGVQQLSLF